MFTTKLKTTATMVAQIPAGIEINVYVDESGTVYLPAFTMPTIIGGTKSVAGATELKTPVSKAAVATKEKAAAVEDSAEEKEYEEYTEDQLMEMSSDDLAGICKDWEIDPSAYPGKNTHKKLRKLILDAIAKDSEEAEVKPATKVAAKKGSAVPETDEDDDEDGDELVDISALSVGDDISVYWANFDEWFEGEVISKKGSKVSVLYEDGETELIDEKVHTKIKRTTLI